MKPNIIFIMSDDHAAKAISAYGSGINSTPNIDRIANEGVRLNHCYVSNSICTPSRAAILTGTYNHVNGVTTLEPTFNNRAPHVAKHLQTDGYQTAMVGKWHLGETKGSQPTGFDYWDVLPGQGDYFDPVFLTPEGSNREAGYVTDVITDKSLNWLENRDKTRPFFLMCHHKAPHRNFAPKPCYRDAYDGEDISVPETFDDDYKNRARAARDVKFRVRKDFVYEDLGLAQPEGGSEVGPLHVEWKLERKVPDPETEEELKDLKLIDANTGEVFTFETIEELDHFKYQRYIKRYLATVMSIDESVGRILDYLDTEDLADNTLVIYTSDQGFFLGEHGWFDKRYMYEESLKMPFLARMPGEIEPGTVCDEIVSNVDFAPTFLDYAGVTTPSYMQGRSARDTLKSQTPEDWPQNAYHRYWMHKDWSHNAFAHYGIRNHRYKLIYWYNDDLDQPGAQASVDEQPEWELFDCDKDPLELFNVYDDPAYAEVKRDMMGELNAKMLEIGDIPEHALGD